MVSKPDAAWYKFAQPAQKGRFAWQQRKNAETDGKEETMMADKGYIGRISNTGSQTVKAPHLNKGKKGTGKVKTGTDLRTGGK